MEIVWKTIHADLPRLYERVREAVQSLPRDDSDNVM